MSFSPPSMQLRENPNCCHSKMIVPILLAIGFAFNSHGADEAPRCRATVADSTGATSETSPKLSASERTRLDNLLQSYQMVPVFNQASQNVSQRIRDNQVFYWRMVRTWMQQVRSQLPPILSTEGIVGGDLHGGNIQHFLASVKKSFVTDRELLVGDYSSTKQLLYSLYDIKDLGRGPLLADVNRYIMNLLEIIKRNGTHTPAEIGELTKHFYSKYIFGLNQINYTLTEKFKELKPIPTVEAYKELQDQLVERKIDQNGRLKRGSSIRELESVAKKWNVRENRLRQDLQRAVSSHVKNGKIVDVVVPIPERGGGMKAVRFLTLIEDDLGNLYLKEFKQHIDSGVSGYAHQTQPTEYLRSDATVFLDFEVNVAFPTVIIANRNFDLRDKKIEVVGVPYKLKTNEEYEFLIAMSEAHLQWIGTFHGRQLRAKGNLENYVQAFEENMPQITQQSLDFFEAHVEIVSHGLPDQKAP